MLGKSKCRILKDIRQKIADENDIPYVTRECHYQGDCSGTCPRCESELRYLEKQLERRVSLGKKVTIAALCAGMAVLGAGCSSTMSEPQAEEDLSGAAPEDDDVIVDLTGEVSPDYMENDVSGSPEEGSGEGSGTAAAGAAGTGGTASPASCGQNGTDTTAAAGSTYEESESDRSESGKSFADPGADPVEITDVELTGEVPYDYETEQD